MSKLIMAVTDCEHIDYTQEREVCEANGIGFVKYDLRDEDEAAKVLQEYPVVGNQYLKMTDSLMDKLPNLKCIVRYGMGVDNVEAMKMGVQYLKSLGHHRIGYLSSALDAHIFRQRYQAFFSAMHQCGLEAEPEIAGNSYHISECMSTHLPRLLERGCTAIMCSHDLLAHSAMIHCRERGLRVPEDISILGFDDIPLCRYTFPPLTTIRQDRINIGKSGFYAMLNQLNNVHPSSLLLHPELIERASCAAITEK